MLFGCYFICGRIEILSLSVHAIIYILRITHGIVVLLTKETCMLLGPLEVVLNSLI